MSSNENENENENNLFKTPISKNSPIRSKKDLLPGIDQILQINQNHTNDVKNYVIGGGGPVGLYIAYKLLKRDKLNTVTVVENRNFNRPQVIRIPFSIARQLPKRIRKELWPQAQVYQRIFKQPVCNPPFWPRVSYEQWPLISVGVFQSIMVHYLEKKFDYRFISENKELNFSSGSEEVFKSFLNSEKRQIDGIFCTCGFAGKALRQQLELTEGKLPESKGHGIYWIYRQKTSESYCRDEKPISAIELGKQGVTYAASGNKYGDVQIYTYPVGKLEDIYARMPSSFINYAQYSSTKETLTASHNPQLPAEVAQWFKEYLTEVKAILSKEQIHLPNDLSSVRVYYAERYEYYYNSAAVEKNILGANTQIFFVGDSAGSTDYRLGLSGGRGLLAAEKVTSLMLKKDKNAIKKFQNYWNEEIEREFNQAPTITVSPYIQFKYMVKGRKPYLKDEDYPNFEIEYRKHNPNI